MSDWVLAVERAYVAEATRHHSARSPLAGGARPPTQPPIVSQDLPRALAAIGAVASRYLAVGTPRTMGLVIASPEQLPLAELSVEAHRTWFAPRELRCATVDGSKLSALGEPATITEALAADIVCVHVPLELRASKLRRGTHVNALAKCTLDDDLAKLAAITDEVPGLGKLAAGLVDGRQLDEITVFAAGDAAIALRALTT